MNWTPGSDRVTYALNTGEIVRELDANGGPVRERTVFVDRDQQHLRVHTLWLSPDGQTLIAATDRRLRAWTETGEELWHLDMPETTELRSAHIEEDGSILVTLSDSVVRVRNGKIVDTLLTRAEARRMGVNRPHSFLDDARRVGGAIAVTVVHRDNGFHGGPILRRTRNPRL